MTDYNVFSLPESMLLSCCYNNVLVVGLYNVQWSTSCITHRSHTVWLALRHST